MAVENARIEFLFLFEGGMPHYYVSMMYLANQLNLIRLYFTVCG